MGCIKACKVKVCKVSIPSSTKDVISGVESTVNDVENALEIHVEANVEATVSYNDGQLSANVGAGVQVGDISASASTIATIGNQGVGVSSTASVGTDDFSITAGGNVQVTQETGVAGAAYVGGTDASGNTYGIGVSVAIGGEGAYGGINAAEYLFKRDTSGNEEQIGLFLHVDKKGVDGGFYQGKEKIDPETGLRSDLTREDITDKVLDPLDLEGLKERQLELEARQAELERMQAELEASILKAQKKALFYEDDELLNLILTGNLKETIHDSGFEALLEKFKKDVDKYNAEVKWKGYLLEPLKFHYAISNMAKDVSAIIDINSSGDERLAAVSRSGPLIAAIAAVTVTSGAAASDPTVQSITYAALAAYSLDQMTFQFTGNKVLGKTLLFILHQFFNQAFGLGIKQFQDGTDEYEDALNTAEMIATLIVISGYNEYINNVTGITESVSTTNSFVEYSTYLNTAVSIGQSIKTISTYDEELSKIREEGNIRLQEIEEKKERERQIKNANQYLELRSITKNYSNTFNGMYNQNDLFNDPEEYIPLHSVFQDNTETFGFEDALVNNAGSDSYIMKVIYG